MSRIRLTAAQGRSATFENPRHDHPKLIRYSLSKDGSLTAELQGKEGQQMFVFKPRPRSAQKP